MSRIRLICPNCGAQYEVPVEVIPEGGRDVQCSNCAHTWFQNHPDDDPNLAEELGQPSPAEEWTPEPEAPPSPEPQTSDEEDDEEWDRPATAGRGLDPQVAEVLREEADLERRQREVEAASFEMQPDLGLAEPSVDAQTRRAREARDRMARIRGEELDDAAPVAEPVVEAPAARPPRPSQAALAGRAAAEAAAAAAESRRELLPDVEEINQTLRASSEPRVTDSNEGRVSVDHSIKPPKQGGGFAKGFFLIVVLAAMAIAVYASAPQIKTALPPVASALDAYVAQVDSLRAWLDGQVTVLMQSLDGMSSEGQDPAGE